MSQLAQPQPHTVDSKLFLSPHTLARPPPHPLGSPEEIEVDGGELVLDEGPERPEKVRRLEAEQRG